MLELLDRLFCCCFLWKFPKINVHKIQKFSFATRVAFCCHSRPKCLSNSFSAPISITTPPFTPALSLWFLKLSSPQAARVHFHSHLNLATLANCATWRKGIVLSAAAVGPRRQKLCFNLHTAKRLQLDHLTLYSQCVCLCAYQYVQVVTTVWMGLFAAHSLDSQCWWLAQHWILWVHSL